MKQFPGRNIISLKTIFAFAIFGLAVSFGSTLTSAQSGVCNFSNNSTILPSDTSCDGKDIVIGDGTHEVWVTIGGTHSFSNLTVKSNGHLTQSALESGDYNHATTDTYDGLIKHGDWIVHDGVNKMVSLNVAGTTTIEGGGQINVTGKGYRGATSVGPEGCLGIGSAPGSGTTSFPACNYGDGPGGGVAIGEGVTSAVNGVPVPYVRKDWVSGSGASYGNEGGYGGSIDSGDATLETFAFPGLSYDYQDGYRDERGDIFIYGSGGAASRNLGQSSTEVQGGAGGGAVRIVTNKIIGEGEIISNGDSGQVNGAWIGGKYKDYGAGSSGSGGMIFIDVTGTASDSSKFCADVSGGVGPSDSDPQKPRNGKAGSKSIAINEETNCGSANTLKISARGGDGVFSSEFGKAYENAPGGGGIVATGGGGGRVNVINWSEPPPHYYNLTAGLSAAPSSGIGSLSNVTLTGTETDDAGGLTQGVVDWQFSCDDPTLDNAINGVLLESDKDKASPFTPASKCNYLEPGIYFPKLVVSKSPNGGGYYNSSSIRVRVDVSQIVTPTPTPTPTASLSPIANLPTVSISAIPNKISKGQSSTLSWNSSNADVLLIDNGIGSVTIPNGTKVVTPPVTTTYTITARNNNGMATSSVSVEVTQSLSCLLKINGQAGNVSGNEVFTANLSGQQTLNVSPPFDYTFYCNTLGPNPSPSEEQRKFTNILSSIKDDDTSCQYSTGGTNRAVYFPAVKIEKSGYEPSICRSQVEVLPQPQTPIPPTPVPQTPTPAPVTPTPIVPTPTPVVVTDSNISVFIEKRTFKVAADGSNRTEQSTFEPGDKVAVQLHLNPNGNKDIEGKITDYRPISSILPKELTTPSDRDKYCGIPTTFAAPSGDFASSEGSDNAVWDKATLPLGDSYFCYTYDINSSFEAKNEVTQSGATVTRTLNNQVLGKADNYIMVRGYPFNNTEAAAPKKIGEAYSPIDDLLSFSQVSAQNSDKSKYLGSAIGYIYKKGLGPKSRGGILLSLPVTIIDSKLDDIIASDMTYVLYNPTFYLFGNVFSGSSVIGPSLDLGSRSAAITRSQFPTDKSNKLNSEASLYSYDFDPSSVIFWDRNNDDKNASMYNNINKLIPPNSSNNTCTLGKDDLSGGNVYLDNPDCNARGLTSSNLWPNGRVWYMKANSDVEIGAQVKKKGTVIIDFSGSPNSKVKINTTDSNAEALGLIVINGGNVEFSSESDSFNGIVFAPGSKQSAATCPDGVISFEEGGKPVKIRGSLVSDCIKFNPRDKNGAKYSVTIYSDQKLLYSALPGFDNILNVIMGR